MKANFLKRIASILILIFLFGCNPVKQVLRDPEKLNKVAVEVIKQGYCANDTTIITKSDTLLVVDSLLEIRRDTTKIKDSIFITLWQSKNYVKTFTIRDTIRSVIVDNARVKLLEADLSKANDKAIHWQDIANKTLGWLIFLVLGLGAFIYLKLKK
jgi:hypothetical protein